MHTLTLEAGPHPEVTCEVVRRRGQRRAVITVRFDARVRITVPHTFSQAALVRFLREQHRWLAREVARRAGPSVVARGEHYRVHKESARAFIEHELQALAPHTVAPRRVFIRHNSSRWGSCSSRKTLSFDYRLLFLPREVARYVIIHELCHLTELNHSPRFWALVARKVPQYHTLRRTLRTYSLHTLYP